MVWRTKLAMRKSRRLQFHILLHLRPTRLLWITGCEFGLINFPSLAVVLP